MKILAHRGYWNNQSECNSPQALRSAIERGYGFESDVRDYKGHVVISHNMANSDCQDVEEVFQWLQEFNDKFCFAINIKADGLKDILKLYCGVYRISNYFLFDMSVPQMVEFREVGLRYFTRQSEVEPTPCMYEDAAGVWIDGFWTVDWITKELLENHLRNGKEVCLVSPDLHGKTDYKNFWRKLKEYHLNNIMLCTDYPDEAKEFFNE